MRAAAFGQRAEGRREECPGGAGSAARSPGGLEDNSQFAAGARLSLDAEESEKGTPAGKIRDASGSTHSKGKIQVYSGRQATRALWLAGEMGLSRPVKSHTGRVIDLEWGKSGTGSDLEDMGTGGSGDETEHTWWAPAAPHFAPEELEWSEDEEEWCRGGRGPEEGDKGGKSDGRQACPILWEKKWGNNGKKGEGQNGVPATHRYYGQAVRGPSTGKQGQG